VSDDPEMQDRRSKATERMISESSSPTLYSEEIRSTLMGKRGLARFRLLGVAPLASVRAVATCAWDLGPHYVQMPISWMSRMIVPYRKSKENDVSPYFSFRPAIDGDYAVLIRDPIVTDSSLQPVVVSGWSGSSIRVSPEMCHPLNLDFDGDEVHILIVSSPEARKEILEAINRSTLDKFSHENIRNSLPFPPSHAASTDIDFMVGTTASMSQLSSVSYTSKQCNMSRCKEAQRKRFISLANEGPQSNIGDMLNIWTNSCMNLAASNIKVPMGYVLGRQLKIAASTVTTSNGISTVMWPRGDIKVSSVSPTLLSPSFDAYGYPGMRLASRLAGGVMQNYLDIAKGLSVSTDDALMRGLFVGSVEYYNIVLRDGKVFSLTGSIDDPIDSVIASTNPSVLRAMRSESLVLKSCCTLVKLACMKQSVVHSNEEVLELATLVYWSFMKTGGFNITNTNSSRFMSNVGSDFMTASLCESVVLMDEVIPKLRGSSILPNTPYCAISLGNMSSLMHLSLGRQP